MNYKEQLEIELTFDEVATILKQHFENMRDDFDLESAFVTYTPETCLKCEDKSSAVMFQVTSNREYDQDH